MFWSFSFVQIQIYVYAPVICNHGKLRGRARARGAGVERLIGSPLYADLGLGASDPRAWCRKGEGGNGRGP